ncbi:MAG: ADP-ribosylglycohydrolase family protein [Ezakiella sp.]|nr:ADP-ribosylglycohydrolase family protein [Ezakiella sp.]MDD7471281.1 ADP-ribosylglycohydrolase family protein [Bacillota bacterium]MDY3923624.1 ADP-ribosylglycohydrolase family protein [Ezakiella sp.]
MFGAIIGDIVGSVYEWDNIKTKNFPFFRKDCHFTDDSVMTIAVADAIMNGGLRDNFIDSMKKFGRAYPAAGYGSHFKKWLFESDREPYGSFGNGSAMRVSPCAWASPLDLEKGFKKSQTLARLSADVTHNHSEGIKGALATNDAIFLARYYSRKIELHELKQKIKNHIESEYGYDLNFTLDEIRPFYKFSATCQETVPQAIESFLESTDFEDAIRNAISIGGDSDTIGAIAGSIAEAAYGIPDEIKQKACQFLDAPLKEVIFKFAEFIK